MPDPFEFFELPPDVVERRIHARQPVRAIGYVQLDESNGGIILNINEGGFAVFAVAALMDDHLPHIRFQIPQSNEWIEASGNIIWRSESKKLAGVRFSDLSEYARGQIREWCYSQAPPAVPFEATEEEIAPLRVPLKAHSEAHPEAPSEAPSEEGNSIFGAVAALDPVAPALDPPSPVLEPVNVVPEPPALVLEPAGPLSASSPAPADPPVIRPINAFRERTLSYPARPDAGLPAGSPSVRKPRSVAVPKTARNAAAADRMPCSSPFPQPRMPASGFFSWPFVWFYRWLWDGQQGAGLCARSSCDSSRKITAQFQRASRNLCRNRTLHFPRSLVRLQIRPSARSQALLARPVPGSHASHPPSPFVPLNQTLPPRCLEICLRSAAMPPRRLGPWSSLLPFAPGARAPSRFPPSRAF